MTMQQGNILPFIIGIAFLVLSGAVLSMLKTALACVSRARLLTLIETGEKKYRPILDAVENPGPLLASIRIGILFIEVLIGCLGLLFFLEPVGNAFIALGLSAGASMLLAAMIIAALAISCFFILGEAIPRQIGLHSPEALCANLFPIVRLVSVLAFPLLFISRAIHSLIGRILSGGTPRNSAGHRGMTEAELRHALLEGEKSGIVESRERTMVEGVFYLGDRPVSMFMTHRSEIRWLDIDAGPDEAGTAAEDSGDQLYFPVSSGDLDEVTGVVSVLDIYRALMDESWPGLRTIMRSPYFIPETMSAIKAFEAFKKADSNNLFVMDEYGGFAGILTVRNLIEEIVGELSSPSGEEETIKKQANGSWLADGGLSIDDAANELHLTRLGDGQGDYHTLAGFILELAGEIPRTGACFEYHGYNFTILEMDGNRIDKVRITAIRNDIPHGGEKND